MSQCTRLWLVAIVSGCAGTTPIPAQPAPAPAADEIETTLLLIGDAGAPNPHGEPVLQALAGLTARQPASTTVVFLGDNVYPRGLPDSGSDQRLKMDRRLLAQLDAVGSAQGIFIPGNHDWARSGRDGWNAILRQQAFIADQGRSNIVFLPKGGCPGPAVVDVGDRLRLVAIDTQWWLQGEPKPGSASDCPAATPGGVADSLRAALRHSGGREVIVTGHHPLSSGGTHGGHFGVKDHIFPLQALKSWLWLPLPVVGSLYPLARMNGISNQDLSGKLNRVMRDSLMAAFSGDAPLLYVAGHDHGLQVLGTAPPYLAVSGAGIRGHENRVVVIDSTRFASSDPGFMRLDFLRNGRVRLGVLSVNAEGQPSEVFSMWLATQGMPE